MTKQQLFENIRREQVTLWAGAGLSAYAGYPLASRLSELLRSALTEQELQAVGTSLPLDQLAEEMLRLDRGNRTRLNGLLKAHYLNQPSSIHLHELIAKIPQFSRIVTTNYDQLFEMANPGSHNLVLTDADIAKADPEKTTIIKIHGDLSMPQTVVLTKGDYARLYNCDRSTPLWATLTSWIASDTVLFLGYGYEDPNIWALFDHIRDSLGDSSLTAYLVSPAMPQHKVEHLASKGIVHITMGAEEFLQELYSDIKEHILTDSAEKVRRPETFRKFLAGHNINPQISAGKDGYRLDGLSGLSGDLKGNFSFTIGNDPEKLERYRAIMEDGLAPPLELNADEGTQFDIRVEGLRLYENERIKEIKLINKPQITYDVSVSFADGLELEDLKADLYRGRKRFTIVAHIHNLRLEVRGDLGETRRLELKFGFNDSYEYTNTTNALKAYSLLQRVFSGKEFTIFRKEGGSVSHSLPEIQPKIAERAGEFVKYMQQLKKIEGHFKIRFLDFQLPEIADYSLLRLSKILQGKPLPMIADYLDMKMAEVYPSTLKMLESMEDEDHDLDVNFSEEAYIDLHGYRLHFRREAIKVVAARAQNLKDFSDGRTMTIHIISKRGKIQEYFTLDGAWAEKIDQSESN